MNIHYDAKCFAAALAAAKGKLSEREVLDAFERIDAYRAKLEASGQVTGLDARMRRFGAEEAERTRIAAAMQRRHAALNILVRDKQDRAIDGMIDAGMKPHRALLAILEGTQKGVENARKSVSATRQAYEARFVGSMMAELQANKPHLVRLLGDKKLDADTLAEMMELREGGQPGKTGNADAQFLAKTFAKHAEMSRTDLNRLGASIGKMDGWAGVQMHDDVKMIAAGKDAWVGSIITKLDVERTFPDGISGAEAARVLGDIYDTIITGFPNKLTPGEKGQRVNPANLAKSLGKSRVLHFRDAAATLAYQQEFGYGNTISGMFSHLRNAARVAANMEQLGPNPEVMFAALAESLKRKVKTSDEYTPAQKQKLTASLTTQAGVLRQGLDVSLGTSSRPVNVTAAKIGSDIRAVQSMAKLGAALISSMSDTITAPAAAQFRGANFFTSLARHWGGIMRGRPKEQQAEIGYLLGQGFDGMIGQIISPHAAQDGPLGAMAKLQENFFKWNGLSWFTDVGRSVASRTIAAEMGMRSASAFDALPNAYRHVLKLNGIDAPRWDVIRQARLRNADGNSYVTPDRIRELPDDAFAPLVSDRMARAKTDAAKASIIDGARRDVELSLLRFIADETNYSVLVTDARTQRYSTLGLRPGTAAGEAIRYIMQFKSFPLAFSERIVGRSLFGYGSGRKMDQAVHIGQLIAGLTIAGYLSMSAKDAVKGYWPPRDPGDPRTWLAAMQQAGALGIYGDFLFSKVNRFGGGLTETLLGPTIGTVADAAELGLSARDLAINVATGEEGKFSGSQALSLVLGNTPYANLYYVRPALDFLFLNSLREALSPGYLKRQRKTRKREYGQERLLPERALPQ